MSTPSVLPTSYFTLDHDFDGRKATIGSLHYPAAMLDNVLAAEIEFWTDFTSGDVRQIFEGETGITLILNYGYISINVVEHRFPESVQLVP